MGQSSSKIEDKEDTDFIFCVFGTRRCELVESICLYSANSIREDHENPILHCRTFNLEDHPLLMGKFWILPSISESNLIKRADSIIIAGNIKEEEVPSLLRCMKTVKKGVNVSLWELESKDRSLQLALEETKIETEIIPQRNITSPSKYFKQMIGKMHSRLIHKRELALSAGQ